MRTGLRPATLLLGLVPLALGVQACSSSDASPTNAVTVTTKEYSFKASNAKVRAGDVTITVDNKGSLEHEVVVFRSDLADTGLPLTSAGDRIDEEGQGIEHLDPEAEDVAPGTTKAITINLPAGRYVVVCNLAGHYGKGMRTVLTSS